MQSAIILCPNALGCILSQEPMPAEIIIPKRRGKAKVKVSTKSEYETSDGGSGDRRSSESRGRHRGGVDSKFDSLGIKDGGRAATTQG